jgi:hypothetical protein
MWWTEWSSRSTRIPVNITHAHGNATVHVNQQTNGGRWNSQGQFHFQAGTTYRVAITSQPGPSSSCADAVRFQLVQEVIVDNRASQTSRTGTWSVSSSSGHYDRDSLWSRDGSTFTWHFTPSQSGVYDVGMWWTQWSSRNTRIPVNIAHAQGNATVYVNQQVNGGQWNSQGQFQFQAGTTYRVTITAQPGPSSTCADAVRFRLLNEDNPVNVVQPVMSTIVDNRSSQTSQTGSWGVSSGSNPYDRDSLWSRNGSSFTWHFTPSQSGVYDVGMWWTQWGSRNTRIPVNIAHAQGNATVYVNQQVNGGRWNSQGQFQFQAGTTYRVTITAQPGPSSTCADAVRFRLISAN